MIAAVFCLHCVLIVFLCQPLAVNQKDVDMSKESMTDSFITQYLENIEQSNINLYNIPCREVIQLLVTIVAGCFIVYQIVRIKRNNKEVEVIFQSCMETNARVRTLEEFYDKTACLFELLDKKSKQLKGRFDKAKKMVDDKQIFCQINDDMCLLKSTWNTQYDKLRMMKMSNIDEICMVDIKAQLVMAKGLVDREIQKVCNIMDEDRISLEEVASDVKKLQRYFNSKPLRRTLANYR